MSNLNISAYGEGVMYPPLLSTHLAAVQTAGWTSVVVGLFHIDASGNIGFNDTPIITNTASTASYVGDSTWPGLLAQLLQPAAGATTTVSTLLASFGGGGVSDFTNVQAIYEANSNSFAGTPLQQNFQLLRNTFPAISLIDMDVEDNYDAPSFVALCQMLGAMGFGITFCPYTNTSFWTGALATLNVSNPGLVQYWNLQCYDGGQGNSPVQWAQAIEKAIPGFNTNAYIVAGDWSRNLVQPKKSPAYWQGDCPPAVTALLNSFNAPACLGGGFIWTIDQILAYAANQQILPDPAPCGSVTLASYAQAIQAASYSAFSLTVELVNDSDRDDSAVFMLLTGTAVDVTGGVTTLQLPQSTTGSTTAGALQSMTASGTLVSTQTGKTCNIYPFQVNTLSSGRLLVSFDSALVYANNAAPTATNQTMRWDKLEFGFPGSGADLTSIDFFGIPLQFEYFDAWGKLLTRMTYYTSTPTLLNTMYQLDTSAMPAAFQQYGSGALSYNWTPGTDPLANFVRLLGPQTLAAQNNPPTPYPSFAGYLNALVSAGTPFTLNGIGGVGAPAPANNSVSYSYTGTVTSDNAGGYLVQLTGTTTGVAPNTANTPYGLATDTSGTTTSAALPANLPVTLALPAGAFDNDIYGAEASAYTVGQSTTPGGANYLAPDLVVYSQNSAYANIAGDFIAALHFGYPGGAWGTNSSAWYSNPPMAYPFAGARTTNDGFYNPYAAVFYNLSDAYGFPFSDRGGRPSPYVPLPANATTMRVTVLNDARLDAPQVSNVTCTDTSITLNWGAVTPPAGFTLTGYTVTISPSAAVASQTTTTTTANFGNLEPGTRYTFSVVATGTGANGNAVQSFALPLSATTSGSVSALAGDIQFLITLNWGVPAPMPSGTTFNINASSYTPSATATPVTVLGSAGLNTVSLQMLNSAGKAVYSGNYAITLAGTSNAYTVGSGSFMLDGNSQPLTQAGAPGTPPYNAGKGLFLVVGTPFAPVADKQVNAVAFPAA